MSSALVLLAPGCEEIEAVTIIDILRRGKVEVTVAGVRDDEILVASRGVRLKPEVALDVVIASSTSFDAVVLPGGQRGVDHLKSDPRVLDLIRTQLASERLLGAICAAPQALREAGVLTNRRITSFPGAVPQDGEGYTYLTDNVVEDGNLVTSRGPGTAVDFALHLLARLEGHATRQDVESKLTGR